MGRTGRALSIVMMVTFVMVIAGCQSGTDRFDGTDQPDNLGCVDRDGDGFGVNCEGGYDCNDHDASLHADCPGVDPCSVRPAAGCPCDVEGSTADCTASTPAISEDGTRECYAGVRTCTDGAWSRCENMESYLAGGESGDGVEGVDRDPVTEGAQLCDAHSGWDFCGEAPWGGILPGDISGHMDYATTCDWVCSYLHTCPSAVDLRGGNPVSDSLNMMYDADPDEGEMCGPAVVLEHTDNNGIDPWPAVGTFTRRMQAVCAPDEQPVWWGAVWDAVVPAGTMFDVRVRAAPSDLDLDTTPYQPLLNPSDCPYDRGLDDGNDGNVYQALAAADIAAPRMSWLDFEVTMTTTVEGLSPRFIMVDFVYFCEIGF